MLSERSLWPTIALSLLVHLALVVMARAQQVVGAPSHGRHHQPAPVAPQPGLQGDTFDIETLGDPEDPNGVAKPGAEATQPAPPAPAVRSPNKKRPKPVVRGRPAKARPPHKRTKTTRPKPRHRKAEPLGHGQPKPAEASASAPPPKTSPYEDDEFAASRASMSSTTPEPRSEPGDAARPSRTASAAGAKSSAAAPAEGTGSGKGKRYGAKSGGAGANALAPAFARALPAAVGGQKIWRRLPLGDAGSAKVTLRLRDGTLQTATPAPGASKLLRRVVSLTMLVLRRGRFALSASQAGSGREVLRLSITVSQRASASGKPARASTVMHLGHTAPSRRKPGEAYFTLASGRHVSIRIEVLASQASPPSERAKLPENETAATLP